MKQRIGKLTPQQAKTKQGNKVECFGLKIPASIYLLETTTKHSHFEDFEEYDTTHITGRVFKCPGGGGQFGFWGFEIFGFGVFWVGKFGNYFIGCFDLSWGI